MVHIISNKDGSKLKLEYNDSGITKIKIVYIPSPAEHGSEVTKSVIIKKEE